MMKKAIALVLTGSVAAVFSACGGSQPAPAPVTNEKPKPIVAPEAAKPAAVPAATPIVAPAQPDTAVNPTPAPPADGAVDPAVQKLLGTVWNMPDGTELTFKDAKTIHAKGGKAAMLGPMGLNVAYTYAAGKLELSAMGQKMSGTWDGEKLSIDGAAGAKK